MVKDKRQKISLVRHDDRDAITVTRGIRVRVKASSLFVYIPEGSCVTIETPDGTQTIPVSDIKRLEIVEPDEREA